MGTYIAPDSFPAGTWAELLKGSQEGIAGNVISAQSPGYFLFEKAVIIDPPLPIPIIPPIDCLGGNALEYKTVYQNGSLTLYNTIAAPWRKLGDPPSYSIDLPLVHVTTCKYLNGGAETGEISFFMKSQGFIKEVPGYAVEIEAKYQGTPKFAPTGEDLVMSDPLDWAKIVIKGPVAFDIKPGSCPNPVNVKSQGVLPVAILGGAKVNVRNIDPASITLEGVRPLRWALEDVGTPFNPLFPKDDRLDCNTASSDGFLDLTLKFETQDLVDKLSLTTAEDKSIQVWTLKFKLMDGTELKGTDVVWILNKTNHGNKGNNGKRFERNKRYQD
jgi:hypothetical protein